MLTKENINGKEYNVIRKPFDAEYVREQLAMGVPVVAETADDDEVVLLDSFREDRFRGYYQNERTTNNNWGAKYLKSIICRLSPIPLNPEPKHAQLLNLYAANGVGFKVLTSGCYSDDYGREIPNDTWEDHINLLGVLVGWDCTPPSKAPLEITHLLYNGETITDFAVEEG